MPKRVPAEVRLRIDFKPAGSLGPGKIALLEAIGRSGSLSQAARELDMSYRRAWVLLDDLNHSLAEPVATASVGGSGGGGAVLTPFGEALIAAYRAVEELALAAARQSFAAVGGEASRARSVSGLRRPLSKRGRARARTAKRR
jgi:molybdate transport system regulatory protein